MSTWLLDAEHWAEQEFGEVECGDVRRTERLVQVAEAMCRRPGESLPSAMEAMAELKGAYRLFNRKELTHSTLLEGHCQRTREVCRQVKRCLLINDTTLTDYTPHKATVGLGSIGEGHHQRGFLLHSTLAVKISKAQVSHHTGSLQVHHERELLGIFGQKLWSRELPKPKTTDSKRDQWRGNTTRTRESDRWAEVLENEQCPADVQWIYVADRESDIYECLQSCGQKGIDFVIRACQARALHGEEGNIFEKVSEAKLLGTTTLKLRGRPGVKARTATLELRAITVELRGPARPGGRLEPLKVTVLEAREKTANSRSKEGQKDTLDWVLLTSLPATTLLEALEVVAIYRERWLIEDYHKALKTGTGVERFQLESAQALESVIGITAVLAARLLGLQLLAAKAPHTPLPAHSYDLQVLGILEKRYGRPPEGWAVSNYLRAIARLGGFLGRKSDGSPGWLTIWRGILRLSSILTFLDSQHYQPSTQKCG